MSYRLLKTNVNIYKINRLAFCFILILIYCFFSSYLFNLYLKNITKTESYYRFKSPCHCKNRLDILLEKYDDDYLISESDSVTGKKRYLYSISEKEFENLNLTCDLYNVLRRGRSQKVIGFSLYGNNPFYYKKLVNLTKMIKDFYPGWLMRVYFDNSINKSIICDIECQQDADGLIDNAEFCFIEKMNLKLDNFKSENDLNFSYIHKSKWRWFPIADSFVDIFMSRDTDSFFYSREVNAVKQWINLNKTTHIMRGNFYISNNRNNNIS
jgi:hypothetical protein